MTSDLTSTVAVRRILLADDAFDSRQLLGRLLCSLTRAEVIEARDGIDAIARFELAKPCITFLDIDMPRRTGLQVLEQIRATDPRAFVVIVSGHGALEDVHAAVALGVGGFIVKPYSTRRVVDMLAQYCATRSDAKLMRVAAA